MKNHFLVPILSLASAFSFILGGCGHSSPNAPSNTASSVPAQNSSGPNGTKSVAGSQFSDGRVFIVMYHHIGDRTNPMFRKESEFLSDLQRYDALGMVPVTASEYITNTMKVPTGKHPIVITFDDSNPDQLRLLPDGSVDPKCFFGVWRAFAASHPEFPVKATFFVLPQTMFLQPKMLKQKLAILASNGCEIANHTVTHPFLNRLTDAAVMKEIAEASFDLKRIGADPDAPLALPYGLHPKNRKLLAGFEYQGVMIQPRGVFLVGSDPAPLPTSPKFNHLEIPRIEASHREEALDYWLDRAESGKVKLATAE